MQASLANILNLSNSQRHSEELCVTLTNDYLARMSC